MKRMSLPNYIGRSGARFETTERFLQSTTVVNSTAQELGIAGIPLTHIDGNIYATSEDEMHCFVIGESGCGKTRRIILPTIRFLAKTGESMVVSDPKGELYRSTANSLKAKGYNVQVLNFRKPLCGHRWNPLGIIETLYHSGDSTAQDKAMMMLDDIVAVLQNHVKTEKDPFWEIAAGSVFRGIALFILEYGESEELTFENIVIIAREFQAMLGKRSISNRFRSFYDSLPANSPIRNNLAVMAVSAEDTLSSIMSVFEGMLSLYTRQEQLMDLFSVSEINIASLGVSPTALFFILPDDTKAMYPIATVFVKQIYSALVSLADEQIDGKLPNRVTFLLDEFANFARIPAIDSMLTAARSRTIRFVLVCQSMEQLNEKYGDNGTEVLLSNCRLWLYMNCRNYPFLKRLIDLMGTYISPYTQEKMPLIGIDELQHLEKGGRDKDCQVVILNDRCRPMMGYLPDYSMYDFGDDGKGEIVSIPEPHALRQRKLFDLEKRLEKAKEAASIDAQRKKDDVKKKDNVKKQDDVKKNHVEDKETDGLSSIIQKKIADYREKESKKDVDDEHEN